jgi:putative addiction module killer protein
MSAGLRSCAIPAPGHEFWCAFDDCHLENAGDAQPVGEGVSELPIDYGPGYRIYYKLHGQEVIVLLVGGDKRTQSRDIEKAKALARNL